MRRYTVGVAAVCWLAMFACGCREARKWSSTADGFAGGALEGMRGNIARVRAYGGVVLKGVSRAAKPRDDRQPLVAFEQDCRRGNAGRCELLATMAESGISGTKDPVKAVSYHRLACQSRNTHACTRFAQALLEGRGVARNVDEARRLFDSSCERGDGRACFDLGILYDTPRAGPKDDATAAALFKKGCEDGETGACSRYGLMLALGRGAPRDEHQALTLLKRACHAGDADGCEGLEGTALQHTRRLKIRAYDRED